MAEIFENKVKFYKVDSLVSYEQDLHFGLFVHLTEECIVDDIKYIPGLYFGDKGCWCLLSNNTDGELNYASEEDVDKIFGGDSDIDDKPLIQIKTLKYYHQQIQKEIEEIKEDYATKEYVNSMHMWNKKLPE